MQLEPDWPALAMERARSSDCTTRWATTCTRRYWEYMRKRTALPVFYNAAVIDVPTLRDVRLLGASATS